MSHDLSSRPDRGPRIVAIGGGTGLSTMLRGLKKYARDLTAIVTMADDGGGSGRLREDLGMPPPGDVRSCLQALANAEPVMEQLINYRFTEGTLAGQSFGNLFLAALNGISSSFDEAVARMGQVLAIQGQVVPVTCENIQLLAEFENGTCVTGESSIYAFKKAQDCRISRVRLQPERPAANPRAIEAIDRAELILLGPGSLYTSVIPNLLVEGIARAVQRSSALRIYVCNVMTQDGETEGYTVSDHLRALQAHGGEGLVDFCLANSAPIPDRLRSYYALEGAVPLRADREAIEEMGIVLEEAPVADVGHLRLARHDPDLLARAVLGIMERHSLRIVEQGTARYIRETGEA